MSKPWLSSFKSIIGHQDGESLEQVYFDKILKEKYLSSGEM